MKNIVLILFLCPLLAMAQPKAEWTFYGPTFLYDKEAFTDKGFNTTGIVDILFTNDGLMAIASEESPIFLYKNGKEYSTQKFVFTKEGAKFQMVKGGETKNAQSMLIDKSGNLWFGSFKGLHKVDAARYQDLDKMEQQPMIEGTRFSHETAGMPFSNVKMIREDKAGNIWVVGSKETGLAKIEHKGLSKFDGTQWTNLLVTGAEDKEIQILAHDDQNNPIVSSTTGLLSSTISWYKDGAWKSLGTPSGKNDAAGALAYGNNTLYAATSSDVFQWKNEKWEKLPLRNSAIGVTDMEFDKNNNLWITSTYGALCVSPGGGEYTLTSGNSPLPSNLVKRVIVDNDNKKWFISDLGILGYKEPAEIRNDNMTVYTKFNSGFIDGKIESIVPYNNGLLLSNSEKGLIHFDGNGFKLLTTIPETFYSNIAQDKNGMVYLGSARYLHKYDGNAYTKWEWKDDVGRSIVDVLVDSQNTLWVGSGGISKYDGTTWQNFNKKNAGLSSNTVVKLFQDSKNNIWATLADGVAKYDGTTWTVFTKKTAGVALGNMNGIVETKDGKIWISNGYKLIEYDGTAMKEVEGFKIAGGLHQMILDEEGTLLMATKENGIVKYKDGVQTMCNQANCNLPSNAISYIYRDKSGKLWAAFGLPPEREAFSSMGQAGTEPAATVENPRETFTKKIQAFNSGFGLIELKKY